MHDCQPMVQAFVITLREGLEAFLIVAISLAYLRKSGRRELIPAVRWGIALAVAISIGAAFLFAAGRQPGALGRCCWRSPRRYRWRR